MTRDDVPESLLYPLDIASGWLLSHMPVVGVSIAILLLLVVCGAFDD